MNATIDQPNGCDTDALNALLRGELSAVETYTRAMSTFDDLELIADLQQIRDEHSRAVRELRDRVVAFGGTPADSSGVWGAFTAAVGDGAEAVGAATVLAALRQGEEYGATEYEAALENDGIHLECQRAIRADLLPAARRHVEELNRLLGGTTH